MTKKLDEASVETLQQRLLEEVETQQRLHDELKTALEKERDLRLENELLWVYLQQKQPARVQDAKELLSQLQAGHDLADELQDPKSRAQPQQRTVRQKVRGRLGKLPGVHRVYHGLKNIGK